MKTFQPAKSVLMPTVYNRKDYSFIATYFKNEYQFCILTEAESKGEGSYNEYNIDLGEPPLIESSASFLSDAARENILTPVSHIKTTLKARIRELEKEKYKQSFIGQEKTEIFNQFITKTKEKIKGSFLINEVFSTLKSTANSQNMDLLLEKPAKESACLLM